MKNIDNSGIKSKFWIFKVSNLKVVVSILAWLML